MNRTTRLAWFWITAFALAALMAGCSKAKDAAATQAAAKPTDRGYVEAVLHSRDMAKETVQSADLSSILTAVRMYAAADGRFPPSLKALADGHYLPQAMICIPDGNDRPLAYIAGLDESSPPGRILVYVTRADSDGRQKVLRLNGQIESLTPAELAAELKK